MKIAVQASAYADPEILTGVGSVYLDDGNLEVSDKDGEIIAHYAAHHWQTWKKASHVK